MRWNFIMNFFFRSVQGFAFQGHLLGSHKAYFVKHPITDFFCGWNRKFALKFFFFKISLSNGVVKMLKLYWEEAQIIHLNNSLLVNEHIHSLIIFCHKKMRNYQLNVRIELRKISYFFSSLMRRWEMEVIGLVMKKDSITMGKTFLGSFGTKWDIFVWSKMIRL